MLLKRSEQFYINFSYFSHKKMMQENYADRLADDEINISPILKRIYAVISYPFRLLAANPKTTAAFILLSLIMSYSAKYTIPKVYSSAFIIRPADPKEKFHLNMLGDIDWLLRKRDYATVASELKLSPEVASKLAGIQFFNSVAHPSPDSINYTEIIIKTTDYNQFIPLQNSLLKYLESNPHFARIKTLQSKQVALELDQVDRDLPQLDSLKKLQLGSYEKQQVPAQSALLLKDLINPTAVYAMSVDRLNKKTALMAQQVFDSNFELVKSCVVVKNHSWPPRVLVMLLYNVPVFLVLCVMLLALRDWILKRRRQDNAARS